MGTSPLYHTHDPDLAELFNRQLAISPSLSAASTTSQASSPIPPFRMVEPTHQPQPSTLEATLRPPQNVHRSNIAAANTNSPQVQLYYPSAPYIHTMTSASVTALGSPGAAEPYMISGYAGLANLRREAEEREKQDQMRRLYPSSGFAGDVSNVRNGDVEMG